MTLADSFRADLQNLVDELDERDAFAPGEAEGWREDVAEADTVADCARLNDAMVDILADREALDDALEATCEHETRAFY